MTTTTLTLAALALRALALALRLLSGPRRSHRIPRHRRYKLPKPGGFVDGGLVRILAEFAVIIALMLALTFLFTGFEPPNW